ncbi:hypothetical protein CDIK_2936 [Cucumispora dikerogammari]|nr:hypothetical protein CDIK_2936 [Cucumispora dikerogammari]
MVGLKKNWKNLNNNMFLSCKSKYPFIGSRYEVAEVFNRFFPSSILKFITTLINKKIKKRKQCGGVTEEEIKIYFGILIGIRLKKQHNYKPYGDKKTPYSFCGIISSSIKYSMFSLINSHITCISEEDYVEGGKKIVNGPKITFFIDKRFKSSHKLKEFFQSMNLLFYSKEMLHLKFLIPESLINMESKYICVPIQKMDIIIPPIYVRFYPRLEIQSLVCWEGLNINGIKFSWTIFKTSMLYLKRC